MLRKINFFLEMGCFICKYVLVYIYSKISGGRKYEKN